MPTSADKRARTRSDAHEPHPLWEMLVIAAPTVITMTSYTVMQFVDAMMVSRIGDDPVYVAAQGNGGIVVWVMIAAALGLLSVVNTFVSQNLGAGKPERGAAYGWNAVWLSVVGSVLILPAAWLSPVVFEHAMGHEGALLSMESEYAAILVWGAFFTLASRGIAHYFYGMHRPIVVMVSVILANIVNIFLNAVLIFGAEGIDPARLGGEPVLIWFFETASGVAGALGIGALGVPGAAIGTVIGTVVEFLIPMAIFLSPSFNRRFKTWSAWRPSLRHHKDLVRVGWPAGLMFANELICWGVLMAFLLGRGGAAAGEDPVVHNSAGWIALRYMHMSFMPCVGLSIAVTAIVGKCIGRGRPDLAAARAWLGLKIGILYMGTCALAFVVFREELIGVFIPDDAADPDLLLKVGAQVMIAAAVFQVFDALAIIMSGALRGAGDTVFPGLLTVVLSWTCVVGVGALMIVLFPGLGSIGPWVGASLFIILAGLALTWRFAGGKWKSIKLIDPPSPPDSEIAPPVCVSCGYDLDGMAVGVACPECGQEIEAEVVPGSSDGLGAGVGRVEAPTEGVRAD